jgi:hypothetical protein
MVDIPTEPTDSSDSALPEEEILPTTTFSWKGIIFFGGIGIILLGGIACAYFFFKPFGKDSYFDSSFSNSFFADFPEMHVPIPSENSKKAFMKIDLTFELESKRDFGTFEKGIPVIVDQFQVYFRDLNIKNLETPGGLEQFREELLHRAKQQWPPFKSKAYYLKNFGYNKAS